MHKIYICVFMWCMARDPVESNFSKQRSQMLFWVSDWVAVRTRDVGVGDGAEVEPEPVKKLAVTDGVEVDPGPVTEGLLGTGDKTDACNIHFINILRSVFIFELTECLALLWQAKAPLLPNIVPQGQGPQICKE